MLRLITVRLNRFSLNLRNRTGHWDTTDTVRFGLPFIALHGYHLNVFCYRADVEQAGRFRFDDRNLGKGDEVE
jgi:hypothetical protein